MKIFLLSILGMVLAVVIWAFSQNAFVNSSVFALALAAVGMCGYLVADFFLNKRRDFIETDITDIKSDIMTLKSENDILRKNLENAVPVSDFENMKQKFSQTEDENRRLRNQMNTQQGDLTATNVRFDRLLAEYNTLKENAQQSASGLLNELDNIKGKLEVAKSKLGELAVENDRLKEQLGSGGIGKNTEGGVGVNLFEAENEKLKAELNEIQTTQATQLATLQAENEQLKTQLTDLEAANSTKLAEFGAENKKLQAILTQAQEGQNEQFLPLQEENKKLKESYELNSTSFTTELAQLREDNQKLKTELSVIEASKTQQIITLETENENLKAAMLDNNSILERQITNIDSTDLNDDNIVFLNENSTEETDVMERKQSRSIEDFTPQIEQASISQTIDNQKITSKIFNPELGIAHAEAAPDALNEPHPVYGSPDDLKVIEGIGPKIEMLLKEAGIENWQHLAEATPENLKGILEKAGPRFRLNDSATWSQQAQLLASGQYDKFKDLTDRLIGGKAGK